jgi:hypothetical protein
MALVGVYEEYEERPTELLLGACINGNTLRRQCLGLRWRNVRLKTHTDKNMPPRTSLQCLLLFALPHVV